ncbi:MAG TPA: type VI secretion system-associated FHA domain protein TagH [Pseudomonas xinjiangensis]|uniref:Type VI secretion system-associated FHA domain protein TagH n=2 Tax=root TaxID=1 RepID=A0A7V1BRB1_9GAMM|nr:type VI secretion system-associated FHA domain protein TagH [Halopseudomonas xinjiangensis]HEC47825.1 type VI secretion system-associated FHA domain protein TagH [Halopseudomonas xinjiangensis]
MELVFDVVGTQQFASGLPTTKTFKQAGGIIGRAEDCDWVIPDRKRVVSGRHAQVSYRDGSFFLTDTSSNGIQLKDNDAKLPKGQAHRIEHGSVFCLGEFEIRARLIQDPAIYASDLGRPESSGSVIPDDAFLELDPISALDQQELASAEGDDLGLLGSYPKESASPQQDYARLDMESLLVPELVAAPVAAPAPPPPAEPQRMTAHFWERFSEALGVELNDLDEGQRETLALNAAKLLRQSIGGLQQSLRTRSDLKSEMRLALTTVQGTDNNPLKHTSGSSEALTGMLRDAQPGQLPASQAISRAFRDLQAHQVALIAASRAAVKGMLDQLSPDQLTLRFESENKTLLRTSGTHWRAYTRLHQSMLHDDEWSKRLFARDFAMAYETQVRLIATLNSDIQG